MASVASKTFAVTGGASGIGAATCRLLAQRGAAVICVADVSEPRAFQELEESIKKINSTTKVVCSHVDVSSSPQVDQWIAGIIASHGALHGAANVAGVAQAVSTRQKPFLADEKDEDWSRILKVNLNGIFHCTRAQVRAMNDFSGQDRSIVNVSSISGTIPNGDVFAYNTSKGGCTFFTACAAADAFHSGIRINCVSPGVTNTPMLAEFDPSAMSAEEIKKSFDAVALNMKLIEPEDVARTIVWLLSEDSRCVFGANINVGVCP